MVTQYSSGLRKIRIADQLWSIPAVARPGLNSKNWCQMTRSDILSLVHPFLFPRMGTQPRLEAYQTIQLLEQFGFSHAAVLHGPSPAQSCQVPHLSVPTDHIWGDG